MTKKKAATRAINPTRAQDIVALTKDLTGLFMAYDGRLWKVRNAAQVGAVVALAINAASLLLPKAES